MVEGKFSVVFCGYNWEGENILNSFINDSRFSVGAVVIPKNYDDSFVGGVKKISHERGIKLVEGINNVNEMSFDLGIMTAYPFLFSNSILSVPSSGWVGNHHSLLPKYRGFHPIQWALENCEKEIGTSIFILEEGADSGDILFQSSVHVRLDETYDSIRKRLHKIVATEFANCCADYLEGTLTPIPQNHSKATIFERYY